MRYLIDANITYRAATVLGQVFLRHKFDSVEIEFEKGISDVDWLDRISMWHRKPVVVSGDAQILANPDERRALNEAGVCFVVLTGGWMNLAWREQAWRLVKVWPQVVQSVSEDSEPEVFELRLKPLRLQKLAER